MAEQARDIDARYEKFYADSGAQRVYPTEFVVRTFLAHYPELRFEKPSVGSRVLDVAVGDGRNTVFLCDQGFDVSGIEITQGIVDRARERLLGLGYRPDIRVGRNSHIPFPDSHFDVILACHCCYYCDEGETLADNLREYARVLKENGWLIASVASSDSYIFSNSVPLEDGSYRINADPYRNRNGYRLHAFAEEASLRDYFSRWFGRFSVGFAGNDYYGISERVFWVVCQKN